MHLPARLQDVRQWRQETLEEIELAQAQVESLQRQIDKGRDRIALLEQLLALESGTIGVSGGDEPRPSLSVAREPQQRHEH